MTRGARGRGRRTGNGRAVAPAPADPAGPGSPGAPSSPGSPLGPAGPAGPRGSRRQATRARPGGHAWPDDLLEHLAVAYHRLYRDNAGPGDPVGRLDWDDLPEHLRESNRSTVRAVRRELTRLGYEIRPVSGTGDDGRVVTLPPEHVQQLAEAEHLRWVREKLARGYVYGPVRRHVGAQRTHPDLVDWEELSPAARDKDRVRYLAAPRLLAELGYEIVDAD